MSNDLPKAPVSKESAGNVSSNDNAPPVQTNPPKLRKKLFLYAVVGIIIITVVLVLFRAANTIISRDPLDGASESSQSADGNTSFSPLLPTDEPTTSILAEDPLLRAIADEMYLEGLRTCVREYSVGADLSFKEFPESVAGEINTVNVATKEITLVGATSPFSLDKVTGIYIFEFGPNKITRLDISVDQLLSVYERGSYFYMNAYSGAGDFDTVYLYCHER